jgi:hypothetical protein
VAGTELAFLKERIPIPKPVVERLDPGSDAVGPPAISFDRSAVIAVIDARL